MLTDGMMSERLALAKSNAYKLGIGTSMNWVDPPPVWPRGPLTPNGGATVQPGVDQMQDRLVRLGYADPSLAQGDNRGRYGTKTEAAVREFQMANGIRPVTGVADEATLAAMGRASAVSKADALAATPEQTVLGPSIGTAGPAPVQDLRVASRMEELGYTAEGGAVDEVAIKNFQTMNGLPETGTLDDATLSAMWSSDARVSTHVMQFTNGVWNPSGPAKSNNCGPASVAMALAAAGVITFDPANPQAAIAEARRLTGGTSSDTTGSGDLTDAVTGQGGQAYPITNMDEVQMAVSSGDPVILFGYEQKDPSHGGAHWVAVIGYDPATDSFLVSDPLAAGGVAHWSRDDMNAYANFSVDTSVAVHNPNS